MKNMDEEIFKIKDYFWSYYLEHHELRILKKLAQQMLLLNESIITNGNVRYFVFEDMGLGVYKVKLAPIGAKESFLKK
jgi:hypothetical protein